jgi:hypothetical protein
MLDVLPLLFLLVTLGLLLKARSIAEGPGDTEEAAEVGVVV